MDPTQQQQRPFDSISSFECHILSAEPIDSLLYCTKHIHKNCKLICDICDTKRPNINSADNEVVEEKNIFHCSHTKRTKDRHLNDTKHSDLSDAIEDSKKPSPRHSLTASLPERCVTRVDVRTASVGCRLSVSRLKTVGVITGIIRSVSIVGNQWTEDYFEIAGAYDALSLYKR